MQPAFDVARQAEGFEQGGVPAQQFLGSTGRCFVHKRRPAIRQFVAGGSPGIASEAERIDSGQAIVAIVRLR